MKRKIWADCMALIACIFGLCVFNACGGEDEPVPDSGEEQVAPWKIKQSAAIKAVFPGKRIKAYVNRDYGNEYCELTYDGDFLTEFTVWETSEKQEVNLWDHYRLEWEESSVTVIGMEGDVKDKPILKVIIGENGYASEVLDMAYTSTKPRGIISYDSDGHQTIRIMNYPAGTEAYRVVFYWKNGDLATEKATHDSKYYFTYSSKLNVSGLPFLEAYSGLESYVHDKNCNKIDEALYFAGLLGKASAHLRENVRREESTTGDNYEYVLDSEGYVLEVTKTNKLNIKTSVYEYY